MSGFRSRRFDFERRSGFLEIRGFLRNNCSSYLCVLFLFYLQKLSWHSEVCQSCQLEESPQFAWNYYYYYYWKFKFYRLTISRIAIKDSIFQRKNGQPRKWTCHLQWRQSCRSPPTPPCRLCEWSQVFFPLCPWVHCAQSFFCLLVPCCFEGELQRTNYWRARRCQSPTRAESDGLVTGDRGCRAGRRARKKHALEKWIRTKNNKKWIFSIDNSSLPLTNQRNTKIT